MAHYISRDPLDVCTLQYHEEQMSDTKVELRSISHDFIALDLDESNKLTELESNLQRKVSECSLKARQLLSSHSLSRATPMAPEHKGVKLPKLDVTTFDGNILNWKTFWEQFCISVHSSFDISDSEKLVYLQHSLKESHAKHVIEVLTRSGEYYSEAVKCLQGRFDNLCLIH